MTIAISSSDAMVLRAIVERSILDLKKEIWHTDHREFRDLLIQREAALGRILEQLAAVAAA